MNSIFMKKILVFTAFLKYLEVRVTFINIFWFFALLLTAES